MGIFGKVTEAFKSVETSTKLANAADAAYAANTGGTHTDFSDQTNIAINMAGPYGTDGAANIIAAYRCGGEPTEQDYARALADLATGNLSDAEKYAARVSANVAWRAGQPFRGLNRLERSTMAQFNELPAHERAKDDVQIQTAAREFVALLG